MTADYPVHIVCAAGEVVVARVRDDFGIHDVTHGHLTGWECSCGEDGPCCHRLAVQQLMSEAVV